jgi:hypothetical protein
VREKREIKGLLLAIDVFIAGQHLNADRQSERKR